MTSHAAEDRLPTALLLALTAATGIVDAVGYLGLDRVFTGNMTGNVVILAMGLTGAGGLPVLGPSVALGGFLVGAAGAGLVLRTAPAGWTRRTTHLLAAVTTLLATAGLVALLADASTGPLRLATTGALGLAMGTQAGAARHVAVRDLTTVVVTSTLVGLAFDAHPGSVGRALAVRRASAVLLLAVGAVVGALLLRVGLGVGVLAAACLTGVVSVAGRRSGRR